VSTFSNEMQVVHYLSQVAMLKGYMVLKQ